MSADEINVIRFWGAQIPVGWDLKKQIERAKDFIDHASECDKNILPTNYKVGVNRPTYSYLVFPEGFLSGYFPDFLERNGRTLEDLIEAEHEVTSYAKERGVGLFLSTLYVDDVGFKRNQCRVYDTKGNFLKAVNKTYTTEYEACLTGRITDIDSNGEGIEDANWRDYVLENNIVDLPEGPMGYRAAVFMCNDFWGAQMELDSLDHRPCLPRLALQYHNPSIIIHCSNAVRGNNRLYDMINWNWHSSWLEMISACGSVVFSVDNSYKMDGTPWSGRTASPSGVWNIGDVNVSVPNYGEHYFHWGQEFLNAPKTEDK